MNKKLLTSMRLFSVLAMAACSFVAAPAQAQVLTPHSFTGRFIETFHFMGAHGTSSGANWNVTVGGDETPGILTPRTSSSGGENWSSRNTGLNAGAAGSPDRALGYYAGATGDARTITTAFVNETGVAIDRLTIEYDFLLVASRINDNLRFAGVQLEISTNGTNWTSMGRAFSATLDNQDVTVTPNFWIESPKALRNVGGVYELGAAVEAGGTFYLRWDGRSGGAPKGYNNGQRRNTGAAIDNVRVSSNGYSLLSAETSPIPEPGAALLVGLSAMWLLIRRRLPSCKY